mmetsp:Transcript_35301/g.115298  ORF Transcript_35301/g.115298 Transcript_35301/m.115298 type:complete len:300 (-) Transcript_35301:40-939(-)
MRRRPHRHGDGRPSPRTAVSAPSRACGGRRARAPAPRVHLARRNGNLARREPERTSRITSTSGGVRTDAHMHMHHARSESCDVGFSCPLISSRRHRGVLELLLGHIIRRRPRLEGLPRERVEEEASAVAVVGLEPVLGQRRGRAGHLGRQRLAERFLQRADALKLALLLCEIEWRQPALILRVDHLAAQHESQHRQAAIHRGNMHRGVALAALEGHVGPAGEQKLGLPQPVLPRCVVQRRPLAHRVLCVDVLAVCEQLLHACLLALLNSRPPIRGRVRLGATCGLARSGNVVVGRHYAH